MPAATGCGEPTLVTERSACGFTVVVAEAELLPGFGSAVSLVTVAVLVMTVPPATPGLTLTTMLKDAEALAARVAIVQVVPVKILNVQVKAGPLVCISDTKVVLAGTVSVRVAFWAS